MEARKVQGKLLSTYGVDLLLSIELPRCDEGDRRLALVGGERYVAQLLQVDALPDCALPFALDV